MYAIVAPGLSGVFANWSDVDRIRRLYPYPKWTKCATEEQAHEWLRRNTYGHGLSAITNYGNTLENLYIKVKYKIFTDCICYVLDCKHVGNIRLHNDDALIEYKGSKINIKLDNIYLSNESISGHMSAIYNILNMLGPYIDVDIELPYYSLFYALTGYSKGNNRYVQIVKSLIDDRLGEVAYSLKLENIVKEETADV